MRAASRQLEYRVEVRGNERTKPTKPSSLATAMSAAAAVTHIALPTRARLQEMLRVRANVFQQSWNPTCARTGAKYLKARLRGPSMIAYYPKAPPTMRWMKKVALGALDDMADEAEFQRFEDVEAKKERGKGTPRKARDKCPSASARIFCCIPRADAVSQPNLADWLARSSCRILYHYYLHNRPSVYSTREHEPYRLLYPPSSKATSKFRRRNRALLVVVVIVSSVISK